MKMYSEGVFRNYLNLGGPKGYLLFLTSHKTSNLKVESKTSSPHCQSLECRIFSLNFDYKRVENGHKSCLQSLP